MPDFHRELLEFRLAKPGEKESEITDVVKPDLAVVCDPTRYDDRCGKGAPDFVIEVLSPSTASRDHIRKRRVYERHGVREFWLVDPVGRLVTVYRLVKRSFGRVEILDCESLSLKVAAFPGLVIDFGRVFHPARSWCGKARPFIAPPDDLFCSTMSMLRLFVVDLVS